jgi:hypothetical protein
MIVAPPSSEGTEKLTVALALPAAAETLRGAEGNDGVGSGASDNNSMYWVNLWYSLEPSVT